MVETILLNKNGLYEHAGKGGNMKNIIAKILFISFISCGLILFVGCSGTATGTDSTTGDSASFEIPEGDTAFYSAALDASPVIEATVSASSSVSFLTTSWDSGNPVYEIFNALRSYTYPDDEGIIDVSNIYKLLFEAGNNYENASEEVSELVTPVAIESPFDFGTEAVTFTHASTTDALGKAEDGETIQALMTWIWDESPKMSYGVLEGTYNESTGAITLDMVYLVDYETESNYCLRVQLSGNESTHEFTLKTSKVGSEEDTYGISMIGKGVSQSESEDDYFLMKIIDNDNLSEYESGRYFKFSAAADEDELRAHAIDGYELEEIEDPNSYADDIEEMSFFAIDGSDHATTVDAFSNPELTLEVGSDAVEEEVEEDHEK